MHPCNRSESQQKISWVQIAVGCAMLCGCLAGRASAADLRMVQDDTTVSIFNGDHLVLHYRYTGVPMKPYADQLFSPGGVQVLRDAPHDHLHHHGLMYALSVDNVDFWGEIDQNNGKELHKSLTDVKSSARDGANRAGFTEEIDWIGPASDKPLLVERRTIELLRADDLGVTLIGWRCRLQTPPGKDSSTITGSHYFGLGMRFLQSMDTGGRFFNADDKSGEIVRGDEQLTATKWSAYTAKSDGKPVTAAIFDHPGNVRHPARMFTMNTPFAYLSATLNAWKEPVVIKAEKPLELSYGVALWDGAVTKETVEKVYQQWLKMTTVD